MKVQFHADDDVVDFVREEIALDLRGQHLDNPDRWFIVAAKNDHGAVVGAMVFEAKTPFDWHLSVARVEGQLILMPEVMAIIWQTIFTKAVRVTMLVDPENKRAERQVRRLGGVYEGFLRRGLDGSRDALVFGLLESDCRYLNARQRPAVASHGASAAMH